MICITKACFELNKDVEKQNISNPQNEIHHSQTRISNSDVPTLKV